MVIGQKYVVVIDSRTGRKEYKQNLPQLEDMRMAIAEKDSDFDDEGLSTK